MPCTFCDAPLPAGARYCSQCGVSVGPGEVGDLPIGYEKILPVGGMADKPEYHLDQRSPAATSTTAVLSLVFGVSAWTLLPIIGAVLAVVAGHQARREIDNSGGALEGHGLATTGLALGYAQLIPIAFVILFLVVLLALGMVHAGGVFH